MRLISNREFFPTDLVVKMMAVMINPLKTVYSISISVLVATTLVAPAVVARELPKHEIVADEFDFALRDSLVANDHAAFEKYLLLGADPTEWLNNSQFGWVMCAATEVGREDFLKLLVDRGFNVNFRQTDISTAISLPLTCAIRFGNLDALKVLIDAGADPAVRPCHDCSNRVPMSAMSEAIIVSKYELAVWLFDKGAYTDEQLRTDIDMLEKHRIDESAPGNFYRLQLADLFREKGYEVNLWTREKATDK